MALLAATGALYYTKFISEEATITSSEDSKTIASSNNVPINNQSSSSPQPQATQPQQSQLQVQGATNQQQSNANRLPLPTEFALYNEYETSESPMYIDTVVGSGQEAVQGDRVGMLYKGYLTTGELFDQSRPNEANTIDPFVFTIGAGEVIPGWDYTIGGMKVGGQRRIIVPSQFGYGPAGQGPIPANATLIFDVELVAIDNTQQPQQP